MKLMHFFDRLEDKIRAELSRKPIVYSIIGGAAIILFWRGIWQLADYLETVYGIGPFLGSIISLVLGAVILLMTGLFTSFFIGDTIIISGIKQEKKLTEKTKDEVDKESGTLYRIEDELSKEREILKEIKDEISSIKKSN